MNGPSQACAPSRDELSPAPPARLGRRGSVTPALLLIALLVPTLALGGASGAFGGTSAASATSAASPVVSAASPHVALAATATGVGAPSSAAGATPGPTSDRFLPYSAGPYEPSLTGARSPTLASISAIGHTPSPVAAGASTASNWYIGNYSQTGGTVQIGGSPSDLATVAFDSSDLSTITLGTFPFSHGFTGVSISKNGGASWSTTYLGQATNWTSSKNVDYGDIFGGPVLNPDYPAGVDPELESLTGFYPNDPAIASEGSNLLVVSAYLPNCFEFYDSTDFANCNPNATFENATSGVAADLSTNGGSSWGTPVPIGNGAVAIPAEYYPACGSSSAGFYQFYGTALTGYSLGMDSAGDAVVAYSLLSLVYGSKGYQICETGSSGTGYYSDLSDEEFSIWTSSSSNYGSTWSAPTEQSVYDWSYSNITTYGLVIPLYSDVHVAVGPASADDFYVTYQDLVRGTFDEITSTNGGSSFGGFAELTGVIYQLINMRPGWGADWFYNSSSAPTLAVDNWSGSAYKGDQYLVWMDNRSTGQGTLPDFPSIDFTRNTGTGWSSTVNLTPNDPGTYFYYDPAIAVAPNGDIWVTFYAANPSNGNYHLFGLISTDGGAQWSDPFPIADAASTPGSLPNSVPIFGETSIAATSSGAYVTWQDCRSSTCTFGSGAGTDNTTEMIALVHPFEITSNVTGFNATLTIGGATSTAAVNTVIGLDSNVSVTVSVPSWIPTPSGTSINEFSSFSGATTSSSDPATFTYTGGNLAANYVVEPGSWIDTTVTPAVAGVQASVQELSTGLKLTPTLSSVAGGLFFNVTVPGGETYNISAFAPNYQSVSVIEGTTNLKQLDVALNLPKENGTIVGTVSLSTGTRDLQNISITLNGSTIPSADYSSSTGRFSISTGWGYYNLTIQSVPVTAYTPFYETVSVTPDGVATVLAGLKGIWINGTVTPYPVSVSINGAAVALNPSGSTASFSEALPGGTYTIVAHEKGYSTYNETYGVKAGAALNLVGASAILLTNRATLTGTISPATNGQYLPILYINGSTYPVVSGVFDVSYVATAHVNVTVKLAGYNTSTNFVDLTPGVTSYLNITLTVTPPSCESTNSCSTGTKPCTDCNNTTKAAAGVPLLDYVGIALIVVIVIVAAVVLLTRRGGGAAPMPPGPMDAGAGSSTAPMGGSEMPPSQDGANPPANP